MKAGIFRCKSDYCDEEKVVPSGECPQCGRLYHRYYEFKEYGTWLRMFVHAEVSEEFELPEGALMETNKRTKEIDVCAKDIGDSVEEGETGE